MPFTTKLKADYVELINYELDSIPIKRTEEFHLMAQELEKMLGSSFVLAVMSFFNFTPKGTIPKPAQEHLENVRYILNTPKDYVESPVDYAEYQQLLKERIRAKITELRTLTDIEKELYIKLNASALESREGKHSEGKRSELSTEIYGKSQYVDFHDVDLKDMEGEHFIEEAERAPASSKRVCSRLC